MSSALAGGFFTTEPPGKSSTQNVMQLATWGWMGAVYISRCTSRMAGLWGSCKVRPGYVFPTVTLCYTPVIPSSGIHDILISPIHLVPRFLIQKSDRIGYMAGYLPDQSHAVFNAVLKSS